MTSLVDLFSSLVNLLRDAGVNAVAGHAGAEADVLVWPWLLAEDSQARNAPPVRGGRVASPAPVTASHLRFLVIATGEGSAAIDKLSQARAVLVAHPVVQTQAGSARVTPFPLAVSDLAAIFAAAGIPLTLCASFTMSVSG